MHSRSHRHALSSTLLFALLILAPPAQAAESDPAVFHGFPRDLTLEPGRLYARFPGMSRVTVIAYHNGSLYSSNVAGGHPRRWAWSDLSDPASLELLEDPGPQCNAGDGSHGTYWADRRLAGSIYMESPGVNIDRSRSGSDDPPRVPWIGKVDGMTGRDNRSGYYPWNMPFHWHQYGDASGTAYISRGGEEPLLLWNLREQAGHLGKGILLGDLMILVDDESGGGVTTFNIAPIFESPAQPPILLDHISHPRGLGAYLPTLWRNVLVLARRGHNTIYFVDISDPSDLRLLPEISFPDHEDDGGAGNDGMYTQCQDQYIFNFARKIDCSALLTGGSAEEVLRFHALDEERRPAGSVSGPADMSQYMYPLGNLLITGPYGYSGGRDSVGVWAHQAEPDTTPPTVGFHRPSDGQQNFPIGAPVSLVINETLAGETIINGGTIILREQGGSEPVHAWTSFTHDDILTLTPVEYLQPDTTYVLELVDGGIKDQCGNAMAGYSFSFTTGAVGDPPVIEGIDLAGVPASPGDTVTFTVRARDGDGDSLEYRLDPGDQPAGSDRGAWQTSPVLSHVYDRLGHFQATIQVRDDRGLSTARTVVVSVLPPAPTTQPTASGPLWLDQASRRIWTVDPDNECASVSDADSLALIAEIDLPRLAQSYHCDPRSIAVDGQGQVWITCHDADVVLVLAADGSLLERIALGHGAAPMQVCASPDGETLLVTTTARGTADPAQGSLIRFAATDRQEVARLDLGPTPRAIAITADNDRALVSRFISGPDYGTIWAVDLASGGLALEAAIPLVRDRGPDEASIGRGVPTYIASVTIDPQGDWAWYSAVKANTNRGSLFTADATHDSTVRAMVGRIRLADLTEPDAREVNDLSLRIDVDNADSPTALASSPAGDYLYVALQGNDEVAVFDVLAMRSNEAIDKSKKNRWRFAVGSAPQGLLYDAAEHRLLCKNFMSRDLTVTDLRPFEHDGTRDVDHQQVATGGTERLPAQVAHGKRLFYRASDTLGPDSASRPSLEGYISCATCHVDGSQDGRVWDFSQRGEGLRNTIDLRGRAGTGHGNVHWTANFDEIQDFELDIVNHFGGTGLIHGADPHPSLGDANAGRSSDLDALAAYVASLADASLPRSPHRDPLGALSAAAQRGAAIFTAQDCATCHIPEHGYTDSTLGSATLHDVGTLRTTSGSRLGEALPGIDTPTLLGLWATPPYLHDGSATTLAEVFSAVGGVVIEAESGTGSGTSTKNDRQGFWGKDQGSYGASYVAFNDGDQLDLSGIDGGSGGPAIIELRLFSEQAATIAVTVGGSTATIDTEAMPIGVDDAALWRWYRTPPMELAAGTGNTISIAQVGTVDFDCDAILIANADQVAKAAPHRRVLDLSTGDRADLVAFLDSLEGFYDVSRAIRVGKLPDHVWDIDPAAGSTSEDDSSTTFGDLDPGVDHRLLPVGVFAD